MRHLVCSFTFLLMVGAALADEPFIRLGDPESVPDEPRLIGQPETARPIKEGKPEINFGFDEGTGRVKHSHRCEGCRMKPDEWHFHHCADRNCKVKIPKNLEFCSKCGWSFCQCAFEGAPQISSGDAERLREVRARESRVRQTQLEVRAQNPPPEPIPDAQFNGLPSQGFQSPSIPSQGWTTSVPYGQPGCCNNQQPRGKTLASGGVNALGLGVGAGVTYRQNGWRNWCAPKPLLGGNVRLGHLRFGTGFDWIP